MAQALYDLGVRQITPLHFADNAFGGFALYGDMFATNSHWIQLWSNPLEEDFVNGWPAVTPTPPADVEFKLQSFQVPFNRKTGWLDSPVPLDHAAHVPAYDTPVPSANARGLTNAGYMLLLELWRRGILVDIDHMSAATAGAALALAERFGVPMIASHCSLRAITLDRAHQGVPDNWWSMWDGRDVLNPQDPPLHSLQWPQLRHEGMRNDSELERLAALGGIIATATRQPKVVKPDQLGAVYGNWADRSTTAAAAAYLHVVDVLGTEAAVALGTDMNGLAQAPLASELTRGTDMSIYGPGRLQQLSTGTRTWDVNTDGLAHYGMLPDLLQRWRVEGVRRDQLAPLMRSAEGYVQTWHRAEAAASRLPTRP